tara:strand:- start:10347 stop:10715 length:369 start_codon:yes stop_codon:yes gene_type:complete
MVQPREYRTQQQRNDLSPPRAAGGGPGYWANGDVDPLLYDNETQTWLRDMNNILNGIIYSDDDDDDNDDSDDDDDNFYDEQDLEFDPNVFENDEPQPHIHIPTRPRINVITARERTQHFRRQ